MNKELLEIWKYDVFQKVNTEKENKETKGKWKIDFLYGEITENGTRELFNYLRNNKLVTGSWSFVDVGSGFGKMVFHAALEKDIVKSTGIETLESKYEVAQKNFKSLIEKFPKFPKYKIDLINENSDKLKELDYSVAFHNSIAWNRESIIHLNTIFPNSIHVSTKSIHAINDKRIEKIAIIELEFSWNKHGKLTPVYLYKLANK